jgi:CDGSH-type Zn-finger protein
MALSYEDLIEPAIVKQVSKTVAYCRCTRTKNPPFCDGSHAATNIKPHILEFAAPTTMRSAAAGDQRITRIATALTAGW